MRIRAITMAGVLLALSGCNDRDETDAGTDAAMTDGGGMDGGGGENTVALCSDMMDNDGNGFTDCNDFSCCDLVTCGAETSCGMRADAGPGMACPGPSAPEDTLAACSDGCSNDHDSDLFVDCNDFDCCDVRSDCAADTQCGMRPSERCPGDPEPENTLPRCMDGCSNDDDTFVDCGERDCCWLLAEAADRGVGGVSPCPSGSYCADDWTPPSSASLCADDDLTGPPQAENSYERCSDGCSNDRDSFQDCGDFKCCAIIERAVAEGVAGAVACAAGTACVDRWTPRPGVELCTGDDGTGNPDPENTDVACRNGCDDDRDGFEDCDDFDCCDVRGDCPAASECGMRT